MGTEQGPWLRIQNVSLKIPAFTSFTPEGGWQKGQEIAGEAIKSVTTTTTMLSNQNCFCNTVHLSVANFSIAIPEYTPPCCNSIQFGELPHIANYAFKFRISVRIEPVDNF